MKTNLTRTAVAALHGESNSRLIELGNELQRLIDRANNGGLSEEELVAAVEQQTEIEKEIISIPATSFAGLAVKLRIACDGIRPDPEHEYTDEQAAFSALEDAERLAMEGGAPPSQ